MTEATSVLDDLVAAVLASARYRSILPDLVRRIGDEELARRRTLKEAIKATKSRLHQVAGAYVEGRIGYAAWLDELRAAAADPAALRATCARVMGRHSSTRERLPILERFFCETLADLTPVRSVLDIACGLNPLAIPWMPLASGAAYYAYDIDRDLVGVLNGLFGLVDVDGRAELCDVTSACPQPTAEVALVLKALPCLEQIDKGASARLLDALPAHHILVSFPVASLGGRKAGMARTYEARFMELAAARGWSVQRFAFASELAFRVARPAASLPQDLEPIRKVSARSPDRAPGWSGDQPEPSASHPQDLHGKEIPL